MSPITSSRCWEEMRKPAAEPAAEVAELPGGGTPARLVPSHAEACAYCPGATRAEGRIAQGTFPNAGGAQRPTAALDPLGEHVHGSCDDEPEDAQRDDRLNGHRDLRPGGEWHGVGRA